MRRYSWIFAGCLAMTLGACPDSTDGTADDGHTSTADASADATPAAPTFRFGTTRGQALSLAPFPNDLYRLTNGGIDVTLEGDEGLATAVKADRLSLWQDILGRRDGFGFTSPIRLFLDSAPDMTSFEGRVSLVETPSGEALPVALHWDPHTSAVVVFPQWGHSMKPATTYIVAVASGVSTTDGVAIAAHPAFQTVLEDSGDGPVHTAFAPLRQWLESGALQAPIIATVFTTESVAAYGEGIRDAIDSYPLQPVSSAVRWNPETMSFEDGGNFFSGDALDAYFGTPQAPFENYPTRWGSGVRKDAALLDEGVEYAGGTYHEDIGRVVIGSLRMPALHWSEDGAGGVTNTPLAWNDGKPTHTLDVMVPFTLFLCKDNEAFPSDTPVAIFQHGGGGERVEAIAMANMNCRNNNIATLSMDGPFHGGRQAVALYEAENLVVPTAADEINAYTGLKASDEEFLPDYQGDIGGATETVGPLFALPFELDPERMEGNLITIAAENLLAIRYLREGDWSTLVPGLSFDPDAIFHTSLSFGSSFTTATFALVDPSHVKGVVQSVPSGCIFACNLLMAPSNAGLAATIAKSVFGSPWELSDLIEVGYRDFGVGMVQWLSQRADPLAWARQMGAAPIPMLNSSNSWDETLTTAAQITFNNAVGYAVYTTPEWTLDPTGPGAGTVSSQVYAGPVSNVKGMFYDSGSCHSQLVSPLCVNNYETERPPRVSLANKTVRTSRVCELHTQAERFFQTLMMGISGGELIAPSGSCDLLYGP